MKLIKFFPILLAFTCATAEAQDITTCAGNGTYSLDTAYCPPDGGQATATMLNAVIALKSDAAGNVYASTYGQYWNCAHIKKIGTSGVVTTVVGNGIWMTHGGDGGPATDAGFFNLGNFCLDNSGNIYIMENGVNASWIRKVNTAGIVSTIAGGDTTAYNGDGIPATAAGFDGGDIATDAAGNIYFTDQGNGRIRKINTMGIISTIAGNGTYGYSGDGGQATNAEVDLPVLINTDAAGNIYFTDQPPSCCIRKITPSGIISTIASSAAVGNINPAGLACDNSGNVYFSDQSNEVVYMLSSSGVISIVAGTFNTGGFMGDGGPAKSALLAGPGGLSISATGDMYIGDVNNFRIRKVYAHTSGVANTTEAQSALRVWPEPNSGSFSLYVPSAVNEPAHIAISNMLGQKIKDMTVATNEEVNLQLDVAPGMYFISANAGATQQTAKMIVR